MGTPARAVVFVVLGVLGVLGAFSCTQGAQPQDELDAQDAQVLPPIEWEMQFGLSNITQDVVEVGRDLGVRAIRQTLSWKFVEPKIQATGMTLEYAMSEDALRSFSADADFSVTDRLLEDIAAADLEIIAGVGTGWSRAIPVVEVDGVELPAAPDVLGREEYMARQVLVTRAIIERYDGDGHLDADNGVVVSAWQLENEVNEAMATAVGYARYPSGVDAFGSAWNDFAYVSELFSALVTAARSVESRAILGTNLHCSIHWRFNHLFRNPTWAEVQVQWQEQLDWVGLDIYPNYLRADPVRGSSVGDSVRRARELSQGRPIYVVETGYPSGPPELRFDPKKQAQYLRESVETAREAGAHYYIWYGTSSPDHSEAEIGDREIESIDKLAEANDTGLWEDMFGLISSDQEYFESKVQPAIESMSAYHGLVGADGERKPAWTEFKKQIAR